MKRFFEMMFGTPHTVNVRKREELKNFMNKASDTFEEAVQTFFDESDWLTESELPAMTSLMKAAEALDKNPRLSATLLAEYGKVYRYLRGLKPNAEVEEEMDDLDKELAIL